MNGYILKINDNKYDCKIDNSAIELKERIKKDEFIAVLIFYINFIKITKSDLDIFNNKEYMIMNQDIINNNIVTFTKSNSSKIYAKYNLDNGFMYDVYVSIHAVPYVISNIININNYNLEDIKKIKVDILDKVYIDNNLMKDIFKENKEVYIDQDIMNPLFQSAPNICDNQPTKPINAFTSISSPVQVKNTKYTPTYTLENTLLDKNENVDELKTTSVDLFSISGLSNINKSNEIKDDKKMDATTIKNILLKLKGIRNSSKSNVDYTNNNIEVVKSLDGVKVYVDMVNILDISKKPKTTLYNLNYVDEEYIDIAYNVSNIYFFKDIKNLYNKYPKLIIKDVIDYTSNRFKNNNIIVDDLSYSALIEYIKNNKSKESYGYMNIKESENSNIRRSNHTYILENKDKTPIFVSKYSSRYHAFKVIVFDTSYGEAILDRIKEDYKEIMN